MNLPSIRHLTLPLALAGVLIGHAEEKKETTTAPAEKHERQLRVIMNHGDQAGPKEQVTFLGVETASVDATLAAQLGLSEGTGLVIHRVMSGSPAADNLKEHDILTKFQDQILIDQRQLSVLVRGKKSGDEVALTLFRAGKEITLKVKLSTHEVPKLAGMEGPGDGNEIRFFHHGMPGAEEMQNLPGMAREDVDHIVRMLGQDHFNMMGKPQVRIIARSKGDGSTILNMNQGNVVFSDEEGSVEVNAADGKRELTIKNPKGEVTFKGPISNAEERKKLPVEVIARLDKIEKLNAEAEFDENFEQSGATVGQPHKARIERKVIRGDAPSTPSF